MIARMKLTSLLLLAVLALSGCQSASTTTETETKPEPPATASPEPVTPAPAETAKTVKPGMTMQEVHAMKGAPKESKHQHGAGPGGSEIDLWVYEDQTIRFQVGKVVE
jgi:PBP1b-binding outer membrane lipoprotein LpoB